jgi:hypothetical protein
MRRTELPPPRPVVWPLRPLSSARHAVEAGDDRVVVTIDHAPLRGVTAEMLEWWYAHVPGTMAYAGTVYPRYLVWHPLDHVSYEIVGPDPSAAIVPGTKVRIREALGRDLDNVIDISVVVEELGSGRAVIAKRVAGTALVRLENEFETQASSVSYRTRLTIGDETWLARLGLNLIAHRRAFPSRRIEPWIRHHVEEIGNLENFLPALYASQRGGPTTEAEPERRELPARHPS